MLTARQQELSRELPATDFFSGTPQEVYEKTQEFFRNDCGGCHAKQIREGSWQVLWSIEDWIGEKFYTTAWNPQMIDVKIPF